MRLLILEGDPECDNTRQGKVVELPKDWEQYQAIMKKLKEDIEKLEVNQFVQVHFMRLS